MPQCSWSGLLPAVKQNMANRETLPTFLASLGLPKRYYSEKAARSRAAIRLVSPPLSYSLMAYQDQEARAVFPVFADFSSIARVPGR